MKMTIEVGKVVSRFPWRTSWIYLAEEQGAEKIVIYPKESYVHISIEYQLKL